ncbi:MAG TPA: hypothetical protein VGL23_18915 [Chloroflexota bacterium]|jgi:hypothetical protein
MIWALRISFWLQALLGIGLSRAFLGMRPLGVASREGDLHVLVGIIAAALAILVLRPTGPDDTFTGMARFFPLLPLLLGLLIWPRGGGMAGLPLVLVHVLLGLAAIGLVEASIARRRRALGSADATR